MDSIMNYNDFLKWLQDYGLQIRVNTIGNSGVNNIMQFTQNGKWVLNARIKVDTDFSHIKKIILAEIDGLDSGSINEVVTVSEVAFKLDKDTSTIRKSIEEAIIKGTLIEGEDCRKSVQAWLIKKVSVKKLYEEF